jgi:hypothetical protein
LRRRFVTATRFLTIAALRYDYQMRVLVAVAVAFLAAGADAAPAAQARRAAPRRPSAAAPGPLTKEAPDVICPTPLGVGVNTKLMYCDVMTERDPASGIVIKLPPHRGPVTLTFDLHNRQTYSEEQVKANRAYARYTATVGVLTADNTLISRAVVQNEFRNASDLVDRVSGGAGPGGVKAVAPTGTETIAITIPEGEEQVSILGEKLTIERAEGTATYTALGRPIAVVSNVMIEYRPAPPIRKKR